MASIQIQSTAVTWASDGSLSVQSTYQVTFTDWEVRMNLGFTPILHVNASVASAAKFYWSAGPVYIGLKQFRTFPAYSQPAIYPRGQAVITVTNQQIVRTTELFSSNAARFSGPNVALDVLIELQPANQIITAGVAAQPVGGPGTVAA